MRILTILLFITLLVYESLQERLINGNEECVACANTNNYGVNTTSLKTKVCKPNESSIDLYCCDEDEHSINCGDGTQGICSDSISFTKNLNSEYLLCPSNPSCGSIEYDTHSDSETSISTTYVPKGGACIIKIHNQEDDTNNIHFSDIYTKNVEATVFVKIEYQQSFDNLGFLSNSDYEEDNNKDLYLVIIPTKDRDGGFRAHAKSIGENGGGLSIGALVGIILGSLAFLILLVTGFWWYSKWRISKRRHALQYGNVDHEQREEAYPDYNQIPQNLPVTVDPRNTGYVAEPIHPINETGDDGQEGLPINNPDSSSLNQNSGRSTPLNPICKQNMRNENEPLLVPGEGIVGQGRETNLPVSIDYSVNSCQDDF